MSDILTIQMAHSGLLPTAIENEIFAGRVPPKSELILPLVILTMDADALTANDPSSTWTERRLSKQMLAISFLVALALNGNPGPDCSDGGSTGVATAETKS